MAGDTPARDAPAPAGRIGWIFSRSALPYLAAALTAAAVMAWYFFVFVPTKLDYFVGLKFRTLAVASGHLDAKVENMARALGSIPGARQTPECRPGPLPATDLRSRYVDYVLPEFQVDRPGGPRPAGLRLSACGIEGTVAWGDVAAQAAAVSRRDFDDLIVAGDDGQVVWQREVSTPRIGNLSELLGAADDPVGWSPLTWRERATVPAAPDAEQLRSTALIKPVNLGGRSSLLLVQAVTISGTGIEMPGATGEGGASRQLYVAGLTSRAALQRQATRVPAAWIVAVALPIMLLFLAIPYVKLLTLTPKERFRFVDLVAMMVATVAAAGLGAIIPFVSAPTGAADRTLDRFANALETRLEAETAEVLGLAHRILTHRTEIGERLRPCAVRASGVADGRSDTAECELWQALGGPASLELDVVIWFDDRGVQAQKWTAKAQITGPALHRPFAHFRDVTSGRLWRLRGGAGATARPFTIDPLRAPTTSELGVVFATPVGEGEGPAWSAPLFLALNVRPQSLVDPVVPPGYGFAILTPDGRVLFHSQEDLSLEENFFDEVGDPQDVRDKAASGRLARWSGDYHGRPHRFRLQPMGIFAGSPWRLVTFRELEPVLAAEVRQQTGTLRLGVLNLVLLVGLVLGVAAYSRGRHRRTRDLLQGLFVARPAHVWRVWALLALVALEIVAIAATYRPSMHERLDNLYAVFVLAPMLALSVSLLARRFWTAAEAPVAATRTGSGRMVATELGLLVLLTGALPAVGFTRLVHVVHETDDAEQWLERTHQQWVARQARVRERLNSPNYTDATRPLLHAGLAPPADPLDLGAPYSYLHVVDRVRAGPGPSPDPSGAPGGRSPSSGQALVRVLLAWSPFGSGTEPGTVIIRRSHDAPSVGLLTAEGVPARASVELGSSRAASVPGVALGAAILLAALAAVYWARRKLLWPRAGTLPGLRSTVQGVPDGGNAVVLLIGAPRTKKDQTVETIIEEVSGRRPVHRIRLLDATLDDATVAQMFADADGAVQAYVPAAGYRGPCWIHVSNLETQLVSESARVLVLRLLERLLQGPRHQARALVVTSSVDPIAHFRELFSTERGGIYADGAPEVSLSRSTLLLSHFRRCYLPIGPATDRDAWCRTTWNRWWDYDERRWRDALHGELDGFQPLVQVRDDLEGVLAGRERVPFDELVREIRTRAAPIYELLWTSCTRSEKLALIHLAQEGFVTAQRWDVVAPLVARGIIVERPVLAVFNHTFRDFLRDIERSGVVHEWEQMEGSGLWVVSGRLIGASLLAGGLFYLVTQDFTVTSLLPVVSGTGLFGGALWRTLLARVSGQPGNVTA